MDIDSDTGGILVTGNTFPYKELLKNIGFAWKSKKKGWLCLQTSEEVQDAVRRVLGDALVQDYLQQEPSRVSYSKRVDDSDEEMEMPRPRAARKARPIVAPTLAGVKVVLEEEPDPPRRAVTTRLVNAPMAKSQKRAPPLSKVTRQQIYTDEDSFADASIEEFYMEHRPAVEVEVYCPSDDDY